MFGNLENKKKVIYTSKHAYLSYYVIMLSQKYKAPLSSPVSRWQVRMNSTFLLTPLICKQ